MEREWPQWPQWKHSDPTETIAIQLEEQQPQVKGDDYQYQYLDQITVLPEESLLFYTAFASRAEKHNLLQ